MNWNTDGYVKIQSSPLYTTRSGGFANNSLVDQASNGNSWSGTANSDTRAYDQGYNSSGVGPAANIGRQFGFPVRCINRDFNFLLVQYGIAVNYVGANTSASWNNDGYTNIQMSPFYVIRSGNLDGGNLYNQLSSGVLWSSTIESNAIAYRLDYNNYEITPVSTNNRQYGFPVCCIA